ncbi:mannonate dehydratase [Pseudovibrio sp. Tun.PSC04-5.I4]|uniref:mannonate dehydratase n=1 Tax=Pseudovibrio sp. Tun.PSC04-5.I4 TaxID=1798213 RepID=UPI00088EC9F6|nr:mannonate dehydratase [Pseudovibrio sp. Tun.PSC04-5.I4]SDQ21607.1 D-mannonate dehydratase [Pseudovibrio sp. Tun.PSC04-5.I4]
MRASWRWFGPRDLCTMGDILHVDAKGIVSALHHIPDGVLVSPEEIAKRQNEVRFLPDGTPTGMEWEIIESLPISEDIKQQSGNWREHITNYKQSLENLAAAGIKTVCYNFMPILDWTRTDLHYRLPNGATCMRFDIHDFAAYDLHLLNRNGAKQDYTADVREEAAKRFAGMDDLMKEKLASSIMCGLPGAKKQEISHVLDALALYKDIDEDKLRSNFVDFLSEIIPVAERLGIKMGCHPDDPPFPLLGLPRISSTEAQFKILLDAVDSPSNGISLCTGSLGVRLDNDLPGMMDRLGHKVHFLHIRNVVSEQPQSTDGIVRLGNFYESEHLIGNTDLVALIASVLREENRRRDAGQSDWELPFRPDHGLDILDDIGRATQPGYPTIGRMKGLAEMNGIIAALKHEQFGVH